MRRTLVIGFVVAVVVTLAATSVVRVPEGEAAFCGGRFLAGGWHLRPPLAALRSYPAGEQTLVLEHPVRGAEGASEDFTHRITYRWDRQRLAASPLDPEQLGDRVDELLGQLDGRFPGAEIGRRVDAAVPKLLTDLPIKVVSTSSSYPGQAYEELAAAARPSDVKLVMVGLDGFDWGLLNRLIGEGRCPTFARMKREGAWAELLSHQPVLSPLIWTSIASGRLPDEHGVLDFVVKDPETGKDTPITNQFRKVHTFWNILSYLQRPVNVVNWWASYPAEPIDGIMVAERVFYQLFGMRPPLDDPANVYPPEELQEVLSKVVSVDDVGYDEVRRYADISRADFDRAVTEAKSAANPYDNRINHLRKILAVTHGVFNLGRWLVKDHPAAVTALYVEGTDTIGHRFAHYLPPKLSWVDQRDYDAYHETMARYYELVDREMSELMKAAPPDTLWMVTADHGFFTGAARPHVDPADFTIGAAQWHRMVGVFMTMGPHVRPGKLDHADIYDLCRTVLWLEGAPISRELQGRELTEIMDSQWVAAHPPVFVDSYAKLPRTWKAEGARSVMDEARLKELQSLGYLSAGGESAAHEQGAASGAQGASPAPATGGANPEAKPTELYNLGKVAEGRGDLAGAQRYYLQALEVQPDFAFAMLNLSRVYSGQGDHEKALLWLGRCLETGNQMLPPRILGEFVREANDAGRLDRALGTLELLRSRWGSTASFDSARGFVLRRLGRTAEAEAALRAALDKDPSDAVATDELLEMAGEGKVNGMDSVLERHFKAVQGDLKRLNRFAVVCLRNHRPDWAERTLRILLDSDSTNAGVLSNLAAALQMQGKLEESAEILARASTARPADPGIRFNYGAVLAALGRDEDAITQLDEAARLGLQGPRLYSARAKVLFRLGRVDDARNVLQEGVARFPDSQELQGLLSALQSQG